MNPQNVQRYGLGLGNVLLQNDSIGKLTTNSAKERKQDYL